MNSVRHYILVTLVVSAAVALSVRVVWLAHTERDFLQGEGAARALREEVIPAYRGVIYDRTGEPLAVSTPAFGVWVDPRLTRLAPEQTDILAKILGLPRIAVRERIAPRANRGFAYVKRRVTLDVVEALREAALPGVYVQPEYRRYYPAGEVSAHVVGMTNIDDRGLEGIEYTFDSVLSGAPGRKLVQKDLRGNTLRDVDYIAAPRYGEDLHLSLDLRLQFVAYRELKAAVASHRAKSASLVMLDARTGEVLALVNQPSYNPNESASSFARMRNRAVTDVYEPGSTIKPFTVLAALESGLFAPDDLIDTSPGYFRVGRKLVQDPVNRGVITLTQALAKSSQVGIAKVALQLEIDDVYGVLRRAGAGEYVGTGLPGEATGALPATGLENDIVRVSMAYGYGLAASPLQLAQMYLTLANGGVRMPVQLVRSAEQSSSASWGSRNEHKPGQRIFAERDVRELLTMMETVTSDQGTAPGARVAGFSVAGKSGTARIVGDGGYDDERHVALFAGITPVSKPRVVMVVVINEPRAGLSGGGAVSGPVFSRVAARSLRLLGVPPDLPADLPADLPKEEAQLAAASLDGRSG